MSIKLKFLGAAQNVTGSRHLLEANGTKILVDCGLYQERQFQERNWEPFTCPPESLDARQRWIQGQDILYRRYR